MMALTASPPPRSESTRTSRRRARGRAATGACHEQEADRVADRIMRKAAPGAPYGGGALPPATPVPASVHAVLRSPGQPLAPGVRAFMEPRFGHDFSAVRVHT